MLGHCLTPRVLQDLFTKAFKTRERSFRIKMGEFQVLDCNPSIDPQKHIFNLPFKEPSQVLLGLLQLLIQSGEKLGLSLMY
jgi:hypothetical protein